MDNSELAGANAGRLRMVFGPIRSCSRRAVMIWLGGVHCGRGCKPVSAGVSVCSWSVDLITRKD